MTITKDNTSYQYLRFSDGKEIFAMVKEQDNQLELIFPMNVACKPALSGGVTIHLGPFIPFTTDDSIVINSADIVVRSSISDQFIDLYDESITAWLDVRDNEIIEIKSPSEDIDKQKQQMAELVRNRLSIIEREGMWEDELEDEELFEFKNLPSSKDIIH